MVLCASANAPGISDQMFRLISSRVPHLRSTPLIGPFWGLNGTSHGLFAGFLAFRPPDQIPDSTSLDQINTPDQMRMPLFRGLDLLACLLADR